MRVRIVAPAAALAIVLSACSASPAPSSSASPSPSYAHPYLNPTLSPDVRADDLLSLMTDEEKYGQMTQIEEGSLAIGDVSRLGLGSVLHGGGGIGDLSVDTWASAVRRHQDEALGETRLGIPLVYGVDAIHGFGALGDATIFPQQIGLGAANDPDLVERVGRATAEEVAATGIRWTFSPVLAVPSDVRWGRTYEAYSQDPARVATLGAAYIRGLQGSDLSDPSSVLATAKHYIGDGSTVYGSSTQVIFRPYLLDQGDTPDDPALLAELIIPYQAAIDVGVGSVMASFSSWGGVKMHDDRDLLTGVLRGQLGFEGFVISDWAGCSQINPGDFDDSIARCVNAGVDMIMVPDDGDAAVNALAAGVASGAIPSERIDEAVRRILVAKFELGLFENPYRDESLAATVGSDEHRALAREAVQESLVLLENDGALPIAASARSIAVVGNAASDLRRQAGGWTHSWQGGTDGTPITGTTILAGIEERAGDGVEVTNALPDTGTVDVCVAVVGEEPYAEGVGDSTDLALAGLDVLDTLDGRCGSTILVVVSGRPVIITDAFPTVDAVVAAWLPGSEGEGVADVLFGDVDFTGTLPMNWPRDLSQVPSLPAGDSYLFPLGFGLTYED